MASEHTVQVAPQDPLICTEDLDAVGGSIGGTPEDFTVDEIGLFEPAGKGDHWFVRVKKRALTTKELMLAIARSAQMAERELGSAGMKDKHAVTTQWISVPAAGVPPERWQLPEGIEVLEVARHTRKLRVGQQQGNRFRIRLVGVTPDALPRAEAIMKALEERGLPNYFGPQRFGYRGQNLARALEWLRRGCPGLGRNTRFLRKLYPSVIQSEIFNRYLTQRLRSGPLGLLAGDVVRLDGSSSVFVVEDAAREQPRLESGDIHITGPMIGPKTKSAAGPALELELATVAELGLEAAELERLGDLAPGARRDLKIRPEDWDIDRLDPTSLLVQFTLPSGSYATQLIRELTRSAFDGERTFSD